MKTASWTFANAVTLGRLAFLPVLWSWALQGRAAWVGIGVAAAFVSDIVDGQLARRMNQVTPLGSRLDTLADALLELSCLVWLPLFRPEVLEPRFRALVLLALGSWALEILVGALRFRRFLNLHLYSGKASGVMGSLFVTHALVFGFQPLFFHATFALFTLANLEGTALMLTRERVDEHMGSILRRPAPAVA